MSGIREILLECGFKFNRQFGQNFVTDTNLLDAMTADAGITGEDTVVEIGAGAGTLTRSIAAKCGKLYSFEIDRNLEPVLKRTLSGLEDKVSVKFTDFMKVGEEELYEMTGSGYKVVANLPYYVTTPIVMGLLERRFPPKSITVMVQKEVAERFTAEAGSAEYGAITAAIALDGDARITRVVPRALFYPVPNVDSAIVRMDVRADKFAGFDKAAVKRLIRASFSMRRKTLVNNLTSAYGADKERVLAALGEMGRDLRARGETFSAQDFAEMYAILSRDK